MLMCAREMTVSISRRFGSRASTPVSLVKNAERRSGCSRTAVAAQNAAESEGFFRPNRNLKLQVESRIWPLRGFTRLSCR